MREREGGRAVADRFELCSRSCGLAATKCGLRVLLGVRFVCVLCAPVVVSAKFQIYQNFQGNGKWKIRKQ